jgi:hypothetical protein
MKNSPGPLPRGCSFYFSAMIEAISGTKIYGFILNILEYLFGIFLNLMYLSNLNMKCRH